MRDFNAVMSAKWRRIVWYIEPHRWCFDGG